MKLGKNRKVVAALVVSFLLCFRLGMGQTETTTPHTALQASPTIATTPEERAEKIQDIKKLFELTKASNLGKQLISQLVEAFKNTDPNVPSQFWVDLQKEINMDELLNRMVPVYDKYLSDEDIKGLISFYMSPLGQKFLTIQPQMMQEAMAIGEKWGMEIGEKIAKKLKEKGYK